MRAGFTLKNFAQWIKDGNIKGLAQVRVLPRIPSEQRARSVFVRKDIKAALDVLEKPELTAGLKGATIGQLARALTEAIESIPYAEVNRLRANPDDDSVRYISDALEALQGLVKDLDKGN